MTASTHSTSHAHAAHHSGRSAVAAPLHRRIAHVGLLLLLLLHVSLQHSLAHLELHLFPLELHLLGPNFFKLLLSSHAGAVAVGISVAVALLWPAISHHVSLLHPVALTACAAANVRHGVHDCLLISEIFDASAQDCVRHVASVETLYTVAGRRSAATTTLATRHTIHAIAVGKAVALTAATTTASTPEEFSHERIQRGHTSVVSIAAALHLPSATGTRETGNVHVAGTLRSASAHVGHAAHVHPSPGIATALILHSTVSTSAISLIIHHVCDVSGEIC
mmetsp:Transcript_17820/g.26376  ORF Transcript_17820/g.26376 Transcript_17820/m.26376 type:complete len:279 (-) Transcript_17820:346-1182(-)